MGLFSKVGRRPIRALHRDLLESKDEDRIETRTEAVKQLRGNHKCKLMG